MAAIIDEAGQICPMHNRCNAYHLPVWQFETYVVAEEGLDDQANRVKHTPS